MAHDTREPLAEQALRVVVLDHTAQLGGAELALARMLDALALAQNGMAEGSGLRVQVTVVLFQPGPLVERLHSAGHDVEVVPLNPAVAGVGRAAAGSTAGLKAALRTLPFAFRLARHLRRLRPDVIHTTSLKADVVGVLVARLVRRPLVWHVHDRLTDDYLSPRVATVMRALARRVPDAVIANSNATARTIDPAWSGEAGGGARRRISVAHPGLAPEQVRAAPRPAPRAPVVGIVGRISPTKDQLTFVRAAALVAAGRPDVRFRIVGDALFGHEDYAAQVTDEVARAGLTEAIKLVGFVNDVAAQLDSMTVCVHAAAVPEPFGQVVTEAMARGVAVVATSGGGIDEIFDHRADGAAPGWLVPPGDPSALAEAITTALDNPDEAAARARAGWESVRHRFGADRTALAVLAVWGEVSPRR